MVSCFIVGTKIKICYIYNGEFASANLIKHFRNDLIVMLFFVTDIDRISIYIGHKNAHFNLYFTQKPTQINREQKNRVRPFGQTLSFWQREKDSMSRIELLICKK